MVDEELLKQSNNNYIKTGKTAVSLIFHENGKKLLLATKTKVSLDNQTIAALEACGILPELII